MLDSGTNLTALTAMDLRIDIDFRGAVLLVTASGNVSFEAVLRLLKQVRDTAKEKEVNKIWF